MEWNIEKMSYLQDALKALDLQPKTQGVHLVSERVLVGKLHNARPFMRNIMEEITSKTWRTIA